VRPYLKIFMIFFVFICGSTFGNNFSATYQTSETVVAIGDIHGAHKQFQALLEELKLIDEQENWTGGKTTLISLGDLLDRGAESRKVIDLVIKLQQQAKSVGGQVIQVLGNHELMVTTGDLEYVSKEEFSAFANKDNSEERALLLNDYKLQHQELSAQAVEDDFNQKYPLGYIGFVKAFSPEGKYGKWLRSAMPVVKVNDSIFVHGGLSSSLWDLSIENINKTVEEVWEYQDIVQSLTEQNVLPITNNYWNRAAYLNAELEKYVLKIKNKNKSKHRNKNKQITPPSWYPDFLRLSELNNSHAFQDTSPMWYRGNVYCHPYSESFSVERILKKLDATRIVVGHTPLYKNILSRMDNQIVMADTGMLVEVYRGNATALIINGDEITTHTLKGSNPSSLTKEKYKYGVGSKSMTDAEIEDILLTGDVIASKKIGTGTTKPSVVTLEKNGKKIRAIHKVYKADKIEHRGRNERGVIIDSYINEIAAFRLDRLLGVNLVPIAVERQLPGSEMGLLQFWIEGVSNKTEREENNTEFNSTCPKVEQYITRYIFDVLIYNDDRNQGNLVFSQDKNMLYLIDHSIAFSTSKRAPRMYRKTTLRLSNHFRKKLENLSLESLNQHLSSYLNDIQIKAILMRRDFILKSAESP